MSFACCKGQLWEDSWESQSFPFRAKPALKRARHAHKRRKAALKKMKKCRQCLRKSKASTQLSQIGAWCGLQKGPAERGHVKIVKTNSYFSDNFLAGQKKSQESLRGVKKDSVIVWQFSRGTNFPPLFSGLWELDWESRWAASWDSLFYTAPSLSTGRWGRMDSREAMFRHWLRGCSRWGSCRMWVARSYPGPG